MQIGSAPRDWLDSLEPDGAACIALAVRPGETTAIVADPDGCAERLGIDAAGALAAESATGAAGQVVSVPVGRDGVGRLLLVGVGDGSSASLRKATAAVTRRAVGASLLVTSIAAGLDQVELRAVAEAVGLAAYRFDRKSEPPTQQPVGRVLLSCLSGKAKTDADAIAAASAVSDAVKLARDLANTPSLEKTPAWLATEATSRASAAGLTAIVLDEKALAAQGFGGIVGVGAGSSHPPRLLQLTWSPPDAKRHIVLVGKGITFDSGGLSIKPNDSMIAMKTDMAGGAAVIATMTAMQALGVKVKVTGLVPMAENMPGARATRPGDILTHWGGRTSEVLNTDAEGRLVLADAIAFAAATLEPDAIVDIATLTGAASLGLGKRHGALYSTEPRLGKELLAASARSGERLWAMPLVEDYRDALDSPVADLRNIGEPGKHYSGGSIVAALFLREFTGGVPWAHLDVAGPARADADDGEISKGATGFGVRIFCRWLESLR